MKSTPMSRGNCAGFLGAVAVVTMLVATGCGGAVANTETAPDSDGGNPADASALDSQTVKDSATPDAADAAETAVKPDAPDASEGLDCSDVADSSADAAEAADSDAAPDAVQEPIACGAGQSGCGTVCVDLQSNPQHCGACGNLCAIGADCVSGVCHGCSTKVLLPGPPMVTTDAVASFAIGDLDGDGREDAAWIRTTPGILAISKGNGDGTFAVPDYHSIADSRSVDLADMDGDGLLDFVIGTAGDASCLGRALISRNDGTGTPLPPTSYDICHSYAVGDVNGDQRPDLVATGSDLRVFLNKGDGSLEAPVISAQEAFCGRIVLGDIDGDGKPELVGACDIIKVYKNLGNGGFAQPWPYDMSSVQDVAVADFNGDSRLDVVAIGNHQVKVKLNLGYGALGPAQVLSSTQANDRVIAIDSNVDGAVDIVAGGADGFSLYHGDGKGSFAGQHLAVGTGATAPQAAVDLTGDGYPEVLSTTSTAGVAIALNRGYYGFKELAFLPSDHAARSIEMEDLDKNGRLDFITAGLGQSGLTVLMVDQQGMPFQEAGYETSNGISGFALKDLNGDDVKDIAAVREGTDTVSVLLGLSNGAFAQQGLWPAGSGARYVAAGDVNGDGNADLVTANAGGATSVMLGQGDGSFSVPTTYDGDSDPSVPLIVDLNLDGAPDLVLGSEIGKTLRVRTNAGDGTFNAVVALTSKCGAKGAAAGDLNGDAAPDIVLPACSDGDVVVLWNNGSGGLSEASIQAGLGYLPSPVRARLGDLDGDNLPDIVIAVWDSGAVTVLRNAGGGSFDPPAAYLAEFRATDFALADVEANGRPGVVMTSEKEHCLILVNDGPVCTSP